MGWKKMYEKSKEEEFLEKHFREYYKKNNINLDNVENREFGYGVYKRKIANRNLSFRNEEEMNSFLRERTPLFFSYSNSYYADPKATPMKNKQWLKADIIYEFDADEIKTKCSKEEGEWKCKKSFDSESMVKEVGEEKKQWFLEESLEEAKKQVFRLAEFLEKDFGFKREWIEINFSGKAGYHIHLKNKEIQKLNKKSRIEMVDYLTGFGMYHDNLGYDFENLKIPKEKGWIERINKGLKEFFEKDINEIEKITGINRQKINSLMKNKESLLKNIEKGILFDVGARTNKEFWKNIFEFVIETYMLPIDRQTSVDLHKIIRVPNTLHGETGFLAKKIKLEELEKFNPLEQAVVFDDKKTKVFVEEAPKFKIKGQEFGPYKNEEVEVPLFCAIYLIGKGAKIKELIKKSFKK
jgi:DNA primase small subunit